MAEDLLEKMQYQICSICLRYHETFPLFYDSLQSDIFLQQVHWFTNICISCYLICSCYFIGSSFELILLVLGLVSLHKITFDAPVHIWNEVLFVAKLVRRMVYQIWDHSFSTYGKFFEKLSGRCICQGANKVSFLENFA